MKCKKRLACDKFDIFVAHTGLVYDATDTNCQTRNGSTHGRGFATFKTLFFNTQDKKLSEKRLGFFLLLFLMPVLSTGPNTLLWSGSHFEAPIGCLYFIGMNVFGSFRL